MSDEFFTRDDAGRKIDAPLHDPILRNAEAARLGKLISRQVLRDQGFSEGEIAILLRPGEVT